MHHYSTVFEENVNDLYLWHVMESDIQSSILEIECLMSVKLKQTCLYILQWKKILKIYTGKIMLLCETIILSPIYVNYDAHG